MLPMASATMATSMMTIHRFQFPGCFGVFTWFPPDGGVFIPLGLAFVLSGLTTLGLAFVPLGLVTSACEMVGLFVWTAPPAPEKDGEAGVSNRCVAIGSCAVAVGDDAFFLFLAGLDEALFCPEIF